MTCHLNLFKTLRSGEIVPTCSISVYKDQSEFKYSMLSGGEKTLIAILFKIVLNSLRGTSSIFLLDEGLDRLDQI